MHQIPLLCPRCGRPQQIIHETDPHHPMRVVHTETGSEECEPRDLLPEHPIADTPLTEKPAAEEPAADRPAAERTGEPPIDPEQAGLDRC